MLYIKKIRIKQFISFLDSTIDLTHNVNLIMGEVKDDDTDQESNGSGKSSIIEAISFALTGQSLRPVKANDLINNDFNDASVILEIRDESKGIDIVIDRSIYRKASSIVKAHIVDIKTGNPIDDNPFNLSSTDEVNKAILRYLNIQKEDVFNFFVLSRNKMKSIISMSDREKKELMNRLSDSTVIDRIIDDTKSKIKNLESDKADIDSKIQVNTGQSKSTLSIIDDMEKKLSDKKKKGDSDIGVINEKIGDLNRKFSDNAIEIDLFDSLIIDVDSVVEAAFKDGDVDQAVINDFTNELDYSKLCDVEQANLTLCENNLSKLESDKKGSLSRIDLVNFCIDKLQRDKDSANNIHLVLNEKADILDDLESVKRGEINSEKSMVRAYKADIKTLELSLSLMNKCPSCGHEYTSDLKSKGEIEELLNKKRDLLSACERKIESLTPELNKITDYISKIELEIDKANKSIRDIRREIKDSNSKKLDLEKKITKLNQEIDKSKDNISKIKLSINNVRHTAISKLTKILNDKNSMFLNAKEKLIFENNSLKKDVDNYYKSIESIRKSVHDYSDDIIDLKAKLGKIVMDGDSLSDESEDISFDLQRQQSILDCYLRFKSFLANEDVSNIENLTNSYLDQFGSDIKVKMNVKSKMANGEMRDKINISIVRSDTDLGSIYKLSEGERHRVILANVLAISELYVNATGSFINIICIDEVMDSMDPSGISGIINTIKSKNRPALIVTQNAGLIDGTVSLVDGKKADINTIVVRKENDYSSIV